MTISNTAELDRVLEEYALASEDFDATVLNSFLGKYPEHAAALRRYAQVQLTFVQPTREEVEAEELTDEEMLPRQSKLLQRMQQLRADPSPAEVAATVEKLATVSGEERVCEVARAIFSSADHGEDVLLISLLDPASPVTGVPIWVTGELGRAIEVPSPAVIAALARGRSHRVSGQRFSTQGKPEDPPPITWEELVEQCIFDEDTKRKILERSERS